MSVSERFAAIRAHYKRELPRMLAVYRETGRVLFDPYRLDFTSDQTPIEAAVWGDLRAAGLPFYPQIPALGYFLDFADPFNRIAIECDGKEWHGAEKDVKRDARLAAAGWLVYRIPGWKCKRTMAHPRDLFTERLQAGDDEEEALQAIAAHAREWYANTSEGMIEAISCVHYGTRCPFNDAGLLDDEVQRAPENRRQSGRGLAKHLDRM